MPSRYNFEDERFEQYNGKGTFVPHSDGDFGAPAKDSRSGARAAQAGRTTLNRAAFTYAVLSEEGRKGRGIVLGALLRQSGEHLA